MMSFQRILLALIFLSQANLLALGQFYVYFCPNNASDISSRTYRDNLNTLLSSLSTNINSNGFYNASVGKSPDRANAIALCRGDVQLNRCRECVENAAAELLKSCQNQKQAINWYDLCMLRYSNETIYATLTTSPKAYGWNIVEALTSPNHFKERVRALIDSLRSQAAYDGSLKKFAAGSSTNATVSDFKTIYSLVQCTPDLSPENCSSCLIDAAAYLPRCCDRKTGGRVLNPSCNLRYEIYPFYNDTGLPVPVPAPMPVTEPPLLSPSGKDGNTARNVVLIVVSVALCLILAVFVGILLRKKINKKPKENLETVDEISTVESLQYAFSTIKLATNDFSDDNKLGQGGFGAVYKGKLPNGQEIAVKRLSMDSRQGDVEFKNEVLLLAKLQHRNLVRLLGFSLEGIEKLLVYEFVHNGSLDLFIFDAMKRSYLNWDRRYKIIAGIARGILYLHEDSRLRIIHRDLKVSNVLLDKEMNPKIADFGMARLFGQDETQGNTSRIVGTYGYMAPEYGRYGQFSVKSDVFSFGVLVLEIISGQKNNIFRTGENVKHLLSFAWKNWREGTAANIVDPFLRSSSGSMSDILRCIHIGLLCVQENAVDRPTMTSVVLMLNSSSLTLADPSKPAFYCPIGSHSNDSLSQEYNSRDLEWSNSSNSYRPPQSDHSSKNDVSITELYPR